MRNWILYYFEFNIKLNKLFSWALYQLQLDSITEIATHLDAMDMIVGQRGNGLQLYPVIQQQSNLAAIKQLLGYVALGSIIVLIYISVHPFYRLKHRKVIFLLKRFSGKSTAGYRDYNTK